MLLDHPKTMNKTIWTSQATMAIETRRHSEVENLLQDNPDRPVPTVRTIPKTIRIGAVSYLNSKPLVEDLGALLPEAKIGLDFPSRLADQLASGKIDVGLIPSVEAFRDPDYEIVSDACVATRGPVHSVKLYSRVHPGFIRTLALDEGSRTSAALARIMLEQRFGVDPERVKLPLGKTIADTTADAIVVIGDRAMHDVTEKFNTVWDLGEEWAEWTGLPFVFAMWVGRSGVADENVLRMLSESRDRGVARCDEIARREAADLNISVEHATDYLKHNLHFTLGPAERSGLQLFQDLAVQMGLAPEGVDLVFRQHK
jgi:chorismate dehydratase